MFKLVKLFVYLRKVEKVFDNEEKRKIKLFLDKLKINPYLGKPLSYQFLREKKINGKRIYFLVYNELGLILLVSASTKKTQKSEIEKIKFYRKSYYNYAKEIYYSFKK